jgi:hypothetical protein
MISIENVSQEGTFVIPAGEFITKIIIYETAGNDVLGGIRFGKSHGGGDVVGGILTEAGQFSLVPLTIPPFSMTDNVTIYFDAVRDWNGGMVNIYIFTESILV